MHWLFPFFYASENWILRKKNKKGLISFEMKFLEQTDTPFLTPRGIKKFWKICRFED